MIAPSPARPAGSSSSDDSHPGDVRFATLHLVLGASLIVFALWLRPWALPLLWPAWSVALVGLAYWRGMPGVFGKSPRTGRIRWRRRVLLAPYYAVAWAQWQLKARLLGERAFDEVAPGVFVGRRPTSAREVPADIALVVDLTSEFARAPALRTVSAYRTLPVLDTSAPPPATLSNLIEEISSETGKILIHCAVGHGRSATVAAALLMRRGLASTVQEAEELMRSRRPRVHLHRVQRRAAERAHRIWLEASAKR